MVIKTFKIYTLGCKVNQYESALLVNVLKMTGFKQVDADADFIIVNTCAVTKSAITKDGRMVNRARKENPRAKIYAIGCLLSIENDFIDRYKIDNFSKEKEPKKILEDLGFKDIGNFYNFASIDHSRYFIKIQDGCEQFCSYCIIPYTRGKMKSRSEDDILEEIQKVLKRGYKEIVLSGIHIGLYGRERGNQENTNLVKLLEKIIKIETDFKIRISSIEITEVSDELIDLMKRSRKICPHLHISLQSGNDKILKSMNRPYNKEYFRGRVDKIRKEIPDVAISTDIIVGFPGETNIDFEETYNFAQEMDFSKIHVFSFSAHKQTPTYSMDSQIDKQVITKRSEKLRKLSLKLEESYKDSFKGKKIEGIVEHIDKNKIKIRSEYYFDFWVEKKLNILDIGNLAKFILK